MNQTNDRNERNLQKEILKKCYTDYDAKKHDAFVYRYNKDIDSMKIAQYMNNRGI